MTSLLDDVLCVHAWAVSGLSSSHRAPFIRIVYDDLIARRHGTSKGKPSVVAVELPEDHELPVLRRRRNEYTAHWGDNAHGIGQSKCAAYLPAGLKEIEVEIWNRFGDVAVHLGSTSVSLRQAVQDREDSTHPRRVWYPMDPTDATEHVQRRMKSLSVQLSISTQPRSPRAQRVQNDIKRRQQDRQQRRKSDQDEQEAIVVDPSFQFDPPASRVEWSTIVSANIRRIFLRGDTEELQVYYNDVLHGNMDGEIQDDEGLVIDEDYLAGFKLCQLAAQYMDHCVEVLDTRKTEYEDHHASLAAVQRERRQERRVLMDHKRRLEKELGELDLMVTTYTKLLETHGGHEHLGTEHQPASQMRDPDTRTDQTSTSPRSPVSIPSGGDAISKRPSFLMTWEEREQVRKQQKELDKHRRIEEEKTRLQKLFQDRQDREKMAFGLSSVSQRRIQRSARIIQLAFKTFIKNRRVRRVIQMHAAAITIQRTTRRFLCRRKWPTLRAQLTRARELRWMEECDEESKRVEQMERARLPSRLVSEEVLSDDEGPAGSRVATMDLVVMWKRLRRVFKTASRKGVSCTQLFARLDSRADGVIDRAEFRAGVRSFGVRIDRTYTRAVIALLRAKSNSTPKPLTLTLEQFTIGFDLPLPKSIEASSPVPTNEVEERVEKQEDSTTVRSRKTEARQSSSSEDYDLPHDKETSQSIAQVAQAVAQLRRRILEAAREHLAAKKQTITSYSAFRAALSYVFEEFDVDGNGELDLRELVECMESINFHVSSANLALLRECFVSDPTSATVSITEFISFALAGSSDAAAEELGALGFRLRDAILERVKQARKQTDSIEDAVRLVFKRAFRSKKQVTCPQKEFISVLASLRLGFTPGQLSRLVVRLNRDGDNSISMDELLVWLRLKSASSDESKRLHGGTTQRETGEFGGGFVRDLLVELAGLLGMRQSHGERERKVKALFQRIDTNGSGKISSSELQGFLAGIELTDLDAVAQSTSEPADLTAAGLAQQVVKLIDLNGNGVVTEKEWTDFILDEAASPSGHRGKRVVRYAVVEAVRQGMHDAFVEQSDLLDWFRSLPGAIRSAASTEMKVRTREFQKAVSAKLPFIPVRDLDEVVLVLDVDGSGWITEKEIYQWQFPTRDIEELTALIARVWGAECQSSRLKDLRDDELVHALYRQFDRDGNGLVARQELRDGFRRSKLHLNDEEAASLIKEFDVDGDGFLGKSDFTVCVQRLVPTTFSGLHTIATIAWPAAGEGYNLDTYSSDDERDGGGQDQDNYSDFERRDEDSDDPFSPVGISPIRFDGLDAPRPAAPARQSTIGVEYSEDFDDSAVP